MDFYPVLTAILFLFLIIGTGFVARRHGILNGSLVHLISHVLVNIALPALTISSMQVPLTPANLGIAEDMLLIAIAYYLGAFALGILICRLLPSTGSEEGVFRFMLIFPNVGFMGIPVSIAVLGQGSLFYVILFNLPFNLLVFTVGSWLLARSRPGNFEWKRLITPGFIASILGMYLFLTGIIIPQPANTALGLIGMTTTPLAMLVVGAFLATLPVSKLGGDWRIGVITAFRLLILPVLAFLVLVPFVNNKLLVMSAVLLIGMPVAANTVLLSDEFGVDATLASQGLFVSTCASLVTIPVLELFLFH